MKRILQLVCLIAISVPSLGQGSGVGYILDIGWSNKSQSTPVYYQSIRTITHNGFIRFHNGKGNNALQLMAGYRMDTISFQNFSQFLGPDGTSMMQYNSNAFIRRDAWKFGVINQFQFGRPGRIIFSLNTGMFYERTIRATRYGYEDGWNYKLNMEINRDNLGIILGSEIRFAWFTLGFKYEKLLRDVLNHDYILSQDLNLENSTELRGLKLNPGMAYLYLGVNIDFFDN
ncbi:hypothetical protein ES705_19803 [subsurface metagenome]